MDAGRPRARLPAQDARTPESEGDGRPGRLPARDAGAVAPRLERLSLAAERALDGLLDLAVLWFAAWTIVYHVCLLLGLGVLWAAAAGAAALVPCVLLARRQRGPGVRAVPPPAGGGAALSVGLQLVAATAAAALFAFSDLGWRLLWAALAAVAAASLVATIRRGEGPPVAGTAPRGPAPRSAGTWPATLAALTWAAGLAVLSLFLVRPDADDAFYGRVVAWIAHHGELPLGDVLFSDDVLPAVIYPPLSSLEALLGAGAHVTGLGPADLLYFALPPLATGLAVLAMWRLLRSWGVGPIGLALSVALVFLLLDAQGHRTFGNFFVGRIWQGKVVFLAALVPLLFALIAEYARAPSRRGLVLLAAGGAAGVGLTSSAAFLVPVIAAGCFAPLALRAPRRTAAAGFAALVAYPLGALLTTALVDARRAAEDGAGGLATRELADAVLGTGVLALVAVTAMLAAPLLLRRADAAQMAAATVLLVVLLYAPGAPRLVSELSGVGRVLWRLNWAVPTAVLVGVLGASLLARARSPLVRWLPAAALCAALVVFGRPIWSAAEVAAGPSWKRPPETVEAARLVLAETEPGEVVLAPRQLSQTLAVASGAITPVATRRLYVRGLEPVPGANPRERLILLAFANWGLGARVPGLDGERTEAAGVLGALQLLGVDVACVTTGQRGALRLLREEGFSPLFREAGVVCMRAP